MGKNYLEIRELYHHGIKGQKWGMRRWQNEDGTLTEAGKERYLSTNKKGETIFNEKKYEKDRALAESSKMEILAQARNIVNASADLAATPPRGSKRINDKDYSKLSDEELRKRVNRLSLERQYGDLSGDNKYVMTGREKTRETLQTVGSIITIASAGVGIALAIGKLTGKVDPKL